MWMKEITTLEVFYKIAKYKMGNSTPNNPSTTQQQQQQLPPPQLSPHDKAILELKQTRDKLIKFQKKNTAEANQLTEKVKLLLKENKRDRAKLALRLKKFKEKEIGKLDVQLTSIHELLSSIESAEITVKVVNGLKAGNEALKRLNALMPIDEVTAVLEESKEEQQKLDEIQSVLANGLDSNAEAEALQELEEMERSMGLSTKGNNHGITNLPDAPTTKITTTENPIQEEEEEEEVHPTISQKQEKKLVAEYS
jgi:charged multivesicular body protein 6